MAPFPRWSTWTSYAGAWVCTVLFLLTLEWGPAGKPVALDARVAMFNRIGDEIQKHDPHQRLRGIHDDNGTLPDHFYGEASGWNTIGQYCQY